MDLQISGKNAVVCGASSGVGRAIADALAAEGVHVLLCARSEDKLQQACASIASTYKTKADYFAGDLSSEEARQGLLKTAQQKLGTVDILVHNTGGPKPSQAEETTLAQWQQGFDSLFKSVVELNHAFIPGMKQQGWGRILCVTSLSVMEPIAGLSISNAIRSAVTAMMKTLADELAAHNITINCVAPGAIATGRIEDLIQSRAQKANVPVDQYQAEYVKAIPAGRLGRPEEFASVVAFLSSQQASYVTGSTICVDGGRRRSTY
jgi:3-oxoacyl-[acyl-carrier protein] reductase